MSSRDKNMSGISSSRRSAHCFGGTRQTALWRAIQRQPASTHFCGSVELDTVRPVRRFVTILNAAIAELQRNPSTKVKLTLEIEAEAPNGFDDADIGVARDNTRRLRYKPDSTGFE